MPDYSAMSVNERLIVSGLIDEWDKAAQTRNRTAMIEILQRVDMGEAYAVMSVDRFLADPKFYGF